MTEDGRMHWVCFSLEEYFTYWGEQGITYDPWLALTAMALRTRRVSLGTTVTPLPSRLPWKLAREAITLDHLSHGRLILGVGLGDAQDRQFGKEIDVKTRASMLDEGLDVLAGLMSERPFSYQRTHYQVNETTFRPGTAQHPRIPIWLGGFWPPKRPTIRAARWDGFCPAKVPDGPGDGNIKPADKRASTAFITQHRARSTPFDIPRGRHRSGDSAAK